MRKAPRFLAAFLAVCMTVTLLPASALAAGDPVLPVSECTLGDPQAEYKLNIVNDADIPVVFDVKVNGAGQRLAFGAGDVLTLGVNEKDKYSVTKLGNGNYNTVSESSVFTCGEYTNTIGNEYSHVFGTGFKVGERYAYYLNDGSEIGEEEVVQQGSSLYKAGTLYNLPATLTANAKTSATIGVTIDGTKKTASVSGNFSESNTTTSSVDTNAVNATAGMKSLVDSNLALIEGYEATNWILNYPEVSGKVESEPSCTGTTKKAVYTVTNGAAYVPVTKEIIDVVDELALTDITLTYTTETEAKVGAVSVDVLNGERLGAINNKVTSEFVLGMLEGGAFSALTGGAGGSTVDTVAALLENPDIAGLIAIEALDNMPKGYYVTLTEVDQNDGLYEGLRYTVPMSNTMFLTLDVDAMLKDALGNMYSMIEGQIPENLKGLVISLPVSVGQTYALEGVRAGKYTLSIVSPGEGWYPVGSDTFAVTVNEGGTATGMGGNHQYGVLALKTIAPALLEMTGFGCASGLLGCCSTIQNGSMKLFNAPGVVFDHVSNSIRFTNAQLTYDEESGEVKTVGLEGATFTLVDRDRFKALADSVLALGETAVNSVIGGIKFDELLGLREKVEEGDEQTELDESLIDSLLVSVLALGDKLGGLKVPAILQATADANGLVTFTPQNNVTLAKLFSLLPRLYGLVKTVGDIIPTGGDEAAPVENNAPVMLAAAEAPAAEGGDDAAEGGNDAAEGGAGGLDIGGLDMTTILQLLGSIGDREQIDAIMKMLEQFQNMGSLIPTDPEDPDDPADPVDPPVDPVDPPVDPVDPPVDPVDPPVDPVDPEEPTEPETPDMIDVLIDIVAQFGGTDIGYAVLNLVGLQEGRFPTGNYILIQSEVPEGRIRNPMMYVFRNTWNAADGKYHTYASVDLTGVMSGEQFAAFTEKLQESYGRLEDIFAVLAAGTDKGLELLRAFIGEGDSYNSEVLLKQLEDILRSIVEQMTPEKPEEPEEPAPEEPIGEPVEEAPVDELLAETAPAEEAPVEEVTEEAPAEEAPAEEEPIEEVTEEAPAVEESAEEAPAEEAPAEEAAEEAPVVEAPVEEESAEESEEEEPVEPQLPALPEFSIDELRAMLAGVLNGVLDFYIPKAAVISYAANLVYSLTGDMFESREEAASVLVAMMEDEELTFTNLNAKIKKLLDEADYIVNGEVTPSWYFYDVNPDIFSNVTVAYHYVLNELLPSELAAVIERALKDDIDAVDEIIDGLIGDLFDAPEKPAPEEPAPEDGEEGGDEEQPTEPEKPDEGGSYLDPLFKLAGFIGRLIDFFKHL